MNATDTITVLCENDGIHYELPMGTPLMALADSVCNPSRRPWLAAFVNNRLKELNYTIYRPISVRLIDITSFAGFRVYQRTAWFLLQKAVHDLWPEHTLHIRHSLGHSGFYCEIEGLGAPTEAQVDMLLRQMRRIAEADYPIVRRRMLTSEVKQRYQTLGYTDKIALLESRPRLYSVLYTMDDAIGYFYGSLAPSSGYVKCFDLRPCYDGFYLALPLRSAPDEIYRQVNQEKLFDVFRDYKHWNEVIGVRTVGEINTRILNKDTSTLVRMAEAVHEKVLSRTADRIHQAYAEQGTKLILISGPSSSGKTTTAKRLGVHLAVLGLRPHTISLDDYFVERIHTPRDENGDYDFEALEAIDLALFNEHLERLLRGEAVTIPRYNFLTGGREWHEEPLQLDDRSVLIIEGIHGLNPRLTPAIPEQQKFKIYVSCITSTSMDNLSRIATTDNRLLRRMTRDYRQRGNNAQSTLSRWASVRRGEERHIFPYQENADMIFNSSLFYELAVLRPLAEPILREVPDTVPEYDEAQRLLQFLDNFTPIYDQKDIPPTSVLREFIGGSTFTY